MLQTRSAKRSAEAAVKIALDLVPEGVIDKHRAVGMVNAQSLDQLFHARIDPQRGVRAWRQGPQRVARRGDRPDRVLDAEDAVAWKEQGRKTILVRVETTPDDVHGMIAAEGHPHREGRRDVARGRRRARNGQAVRRGLRALQIDRRTKRATLTGTELREGDWITIDGTTGNVVVGELRLIPPPSKLPEWLATFLSWADEVAPHGGLGERRHARRRGARRASSARKASASAAPSTCSCSKSACRSCSEMILATSPRSARRGARAAAAVPARRLRRASSSDGGAIRSRSACSIRRCTSFLPSLEQLLVETTELRLTKGTDRGVSRARCAAAPRAAAARAEPDAGLARVPARHRLSRDLRDAGARDLRGRVRRYGARASHARPEVMIPGVGTKEEMQATRDAAKRVADEVLAEHGDRVALPHRHDDRAAACVRRRRRARAVRRVLLVRHQRSHADDLRLQPRRRRGDRSFPSTSRRSILKDDPFQVLDRQRRRRADAPGRRAGPQRRATNLKIGICGEHGGEPSSVAFCDELGLDYVSCSPYRVPIARLAAAQSALGVIA